MVQTDASQLAAECKEWRQILRNYRDEFGESRKALAEICRSTSSKEQLKQIEHFDNQFYIQLINIHDIKQSIKAHERRLELDPDAAGDAHEELLDSFLDLESTLQKIRVEFRNFINATSC